jgi:cytoskeletal protein RodZ
VSLKGFDGEKVSTLVDSRLALLTALLGALILAGCAGDTPSGEPTTTGTSSASDSVSATSSNSTSSSSSSSSTSTSATSTTTSSSTNSTTGAPGNATGNQTADEPQETEEISCTALVGAAVVSGGAPPVTIGGCDLGTIDGDRILLVIAVTSGCTLEYDADGDGQSEGNAEVAVKYASGTDFIAFCDPTMTPNSEQKATLGIL